jgi:TctA family transporter
VGFFDNLALGFLAAATWSNLGYCFVGAVLGTAIGVLPGLGPAATIAMLLPATFALPPLSALIMLAGIYYGAQYGGSTTAILINIPGELSSLVTTLDGHQLARKGRAGVALSIAALSSFFSGCLATIVVALAALPLAAVALSFGPAEYFSLMVLGMISSVVLAKGSLFKAVAMIIFGILLGTVGTDVSTGALRFTFGVPELSDGVGFVVVAMGMFGVGEIISNIQQEKTRTVTTRRIGTLIPSRHDMCTMSMPTLRGSLLGSLLGILPGGGAVVSSFASYALEKKLARDPARFGNGALEGVAAPEAANNAGAQTSFVPMLSLGLPSNVIMAMMIGALIIHGVQPGPGMITEQPMLFWGLIASMWIGNLFLIVLNLPLVGIWARLLTVPYHLLYPAILVFCSIGVYSIENSAFDVLMMAGFGVVGYVLSRLDCEPAPLLLGMILGPMMEENLRRAMLLSRGDPMIFLEQPISAALLGVSVLALAAVIVPALRIKRD